MALVGCGPSDDGSDLARLRSDVEDLKAENKQLKDEARAAARDDRTVAAIGAEAHAEQPAAAPAAAPHPKGEPRINVPATFNPDLDLPEIDPSAYIDPAPP